METDAWVQLILLVIGTSDLAYATNATAMEVRAPRVAYVGEDVELECYFPSLGPAYLYSVRWWRDNDQFYQFIPKSTEPKLGFDVKGIRVDKNSSSEFKVTLRDLTLTSSGAFTCEVMWDGNFETFRKSANMTVIDPPDGTAEGYFGPVIEATNWLGAGPLEVRDDQRVEAVCIARKANPPVTLSWYMNGTKISKADLQSETYQVEADGVYTSKLPLIFFPRSHWDKHGQIILQCTADIPNLFHGTAILEIHNPAMRRTQLSGFLSGGTFLTTTWPLAAACTIITLRWQTIYLR